jgi:F-type H+-transporting ATPase subunit b
MLAAANQNAEEIVATARGHAKDVEQQLIAQAQARAQQVAEDAAQRAAQEKARALAESREEIAKMAVLAAERILREKAS